LRIALGLKAHSGWAALVALAAPGGQLALVDRRRIELIDAGDEFWAKQPYHAAAGLEPDDAREVVKRGIDSARRLALRELRAAIKRARGANHEIAACALLSSDPMPDWSVAEILAVHFRMHKAEGVLFREALARAAETCDLRLVAIREKDLAEHAERALETPGARLSKTIAELGKSAGAPWGADQKQAALAAWVGLRGREGGRF
jgi:hypothetical protein